MLLRTKSSVIDNKRILPEGKKSNESKNSIFLKPKDTGLLGLKYANSKITMEIINKKLESRIKIQERLNSASKYFRPLIWPFKENSKENYDTYTKTQNSYKNEKTPYWRNEIIKRKLIQEARINRRDLVENKSEYTRKIRNNSECFKKRPSSITSEHSAQKNDYPWLNRDYK